MPAPGEANIYPMPNLLQQQQQPQQDFQLPPMGDEETTAAHQEQEEGRSQPSPASPLTNFFNNESIDENQVDQKFRQVLRFIADRADVKLDTPVHFAGDTRVRLLSEQYTPKTKFVSLTTTEALKQFILAWWAEFRRRDITPTTQRSHKLFTLFKASGNKPSLRPYYSADNELAMEPLTKSQTNMPWLPQGGKKVELSDQDLQHLEKQVRVSLRVTNFMESLLQAWRTGDTPGHMIEKITSAFVHATKTQMQSQVALFCQIVQLRRDLAIQGASASTQIQQTLRHAPILGETELFPPSLLAELSERVKRTYETSIIVQTYRKTQNQRSYDNQQPRQWGQGNNNSRGGTGQVVVTLQIPLPVVLPKSMLNLPMMTRKMKRGSHIHPKGGGFPR